MPAFLTKTLDYQECWIAFRESHLQGPFLTDSRNRSLFRSSILVPRGQPTGDFFARAKQTWKFRSIGSLCIVLGVSHQHNITSHFGNIKT